MNCVFLGCTKALDKSQFLRSQCRGDAEPGKRYTISVSDFSTIPRSPFAYWISPRLRKLFRELPHFSEGERAVKQGLATADDFRFVRTSWEIDPSHRQTRWFSYPKGGEFSPFYADIPLVVNWSPGAREMASNLNSAGGVRSNIWMLAGTVDEYFFRPGLSYPRRLQRLAVAPLPAGSIISVRGSGIFADKSDLLATAGLFSSAPFDFLVKCMLGRYSHPQFDNGTLSIAPVPVDFPDSLREIGPLVLAAIVSKRSLDASNEVTHAFVMPGVLQVGGAGFAECVGEWAERVTAVAAELEAVQTKIDDSCFGLYGISDEDRQSIAEGFGGSDTGEGEAVADDGDDDGVGSPIAVDRSGLAADLVSWAVGVGFGRFDVRLATGERGWPAESDPFDPLPACSPGMLTGEDGLPLKEPPTEYPVGVSPVLVDDPGHALDITARARSVFDAVFGEDADGWWADVGEALGVRGGEVGSWLSKGFFEHHLKMYSKSRRKAPILWPLGTSSGSYLVWLYAHRVTGDSLFRVLNDVMIPKLQVEQRRLTELIQESGPNPSAGQRRAVAAQEKLVGELQDLRSELSAVVPLWHPDLNDGSVIVLAPLWRLFAHHKPWANELRKHWDKLNAGDYDWAQLAMHLWPERVIPKCATDRSLAITHGLEAAFWVQDTDGEGKWRPRQVPTTPIDDLIADRANPTIQAAIEDTTR